MRLWLSEARPLRMNYMGENGVHTRDIYMLKCGSFDHKCCIFFFYFATKVLIVK